MRLVTFLSAVLIAVGTAAAHAAEAPPLTVFAAASLSESLSAAAQAYEAKTHRHVVLSFAASSLLAKQIEASAGADVFLSADEAWMDYLQKAGRIDAATRTDLLANALVLIAPKSSAIALEIRPGFELAKALNGGRLALADPDNVPAGRYAKEALTNLGVWSSVAAQLAPAENVRVALAYVARGEATLGIVYRTDALIEPAVRVVATFPAASHRPIVYPAAVVKGAQPGAGAFLAFLRTAEAKAIFEKSGFSLAGQ